MTQRENLSNILHETFCTEIGHETDAPDELDLKNADLLLARGVRVVDQDTLSEALNVAGDSLRQPYRLAALSIVESLDKA